MRVYTFEKLIAGEFINRVNRYVAEVLLQPTGETVECYLPNPGSMLGMCVKNADVRLSVPKDDSRRKLKYTMEAIRIRGVWIGCNTHIASMIIGDLLSSRDLPLPAHLNSYSAVKREVKDGDSRIDFVLENATDGSITFLEVKTVTMSSEWFDIETSHQRASRPFHRFPDSRPTECDATDLIALFPDCESIRAQKHMRHLTQVLLRSRTTSVLVYAIMRNDTTGVSPSYYCDRVYTELMTSAIEAGLVCIGLTFQFKVDDLSDPHIEFVGPVNVIRPTISEPECGQGPCSTRKRVRSFS